MLVCFAREQGGASDWLCLPRFDSPAVLRALGEAKLISSGGTQGVVLTIDEVLELGVASVAPGAQVVATLRTGPQAGSTELDNLVLLKSQ